jgi:hypothetical protein
MSRIRYTLLSDGSSDRVLMPILDWLLYRLCPRCAVDPQWADLRSLRNPPRRLSERIKLALELYSTDLLFIHRDAEKASYQVRKQEIITALASQNETAAVCVIPIRMQEAWLLIDEMAIRKAAGNPNGGISLQLPAISSIEDLPNPKEMLHDLVCRASGRSGVRLKKLKPYQYVHRIPEFVEDFSSLRALQAFLSLEYDLEMIVREKGWNA